MLAQKRIQGLAALCLASFMAFAQQEGEPAQAEAAPEQDAAAPQEAEAAPETAPEPEAGPEAAQEPAPPPAEALAAEPAESIPVTPVREEPAPATALAEEAPVQLDEIQVSAQKRGDQLVKDVPISISVVNDEMIFDWGLTNVREITLFVPNVKVEEAGYFMLPRIRGFSTNNNNKAFEPPAGLAIDGIPYGRVEYFNAGLFDIQRVEVLRGPQGTTFGKNTTAGLIHVISKDPSEEFKGFVDVQRGEYERQRTEFGLGGEVIEGVMNARISGMKDERRGFIFNTTHAISPAAGEYLQGKDNDGLRLKLHLPEVLGSSLKLSYEKMSLGSLGSGIEAIDLTDTMEATLLKYDPNADFVGGNGITSLEYPDERRTSISTANAEWSSALGAWSLTALGGQSIMKTLFFLDTDFSPAPAILGTGQDRSPTRTLELRALSPSIEGLFGLGGGDWGDSDVLIGLFSQRNAIEDGYFDFLFPNAAFGDLTAAAEGSGNGGSEPPPPLPLPYSPAYQTYGPTDGVRQFFDQQSNTRALFTQVQWRFLPEWTLQLAGRYSRENKAAQWDSQFTTPPPNSVVQAAGITEFVAARAREDKFFQPKVSLNWQPDERLSLFVHAARSFKSGGYNAFAFRAVDDQLGFQPEYTRELGFDFKGALFSRTLRYNISLYKMDVEDFQVLTRVPTTGVIGLGLTKVINAPAARAQGLEGDITWLAASWLRFYVTVGLNDTEYLDFKFNECAPDRDNTDGDSDARCDATGKPFPFAPRKNGSLSIGLTPPWRMLGLEWNAGWSAEYASDQHTDVDLDDRKLQKAYTRYRASLGFGASERGWSFKLIGENLTDVVSYIRRGDLAPKQFVGVSEPPRQIYGQFRWSF